MVDKAFIGLFIRFTDNSKRCIENPGIFVLWQLPNHS